MKIFQKVLTSLFVVLLMVTMITPNYFGLVKAEEEGQVVQNEPTEENGETESNTPMLLGLDDIDPQAEVETLEVHNSGSDIIEVLKEKLGNFNVYGYSSYSNRSFKEIKSTTVLNDGTYYFVGASKTSSFNSSTNKTQFVFKGYGKLTVNVPELDGAGVVVKVNGEVADSEKLNKLYSTDVLTFEPAEVDGYRYTESGKASNGGKDINYTLSYIACSKVVIEAENGSVTLNNSATKTDNGYLVDVGKTYKLTVKPADDYYFAGVTIDGVESESITAEAGKTYVIKASFAPVNAVLKDVVSMGLEEVVAAYDSKDYTAITNAIKANVKADIDLNLDGATVQFLSASTILGDQYTNLNTRYNVLTKGHYFGYGDKNEITYENEETIRVTVPVDSKYHISGNKITVTGKFIISDNRPDFKMSVKKSPLTIGYSTDEEAIRELILANVNYDETMKDHLSIDPAIPSAYVILPLGSEVKVIYDGYKDGSFKKTELSMKVIVSKADSKLDAKSQTVHYGDKYEIKVVSNPENLDYLRIIAGLDGEARGYVSIVIPNSLKNMLKISMDDIMSLTGTELDAFTKGLIDGAGGILVALKNIVAPIIKPIITGLGVPESMAEAFLDTMIYEDGQVKFDLYKMITKVFVGEGIALDKFSETINTIRTLVSSVGSMAGDNAQLVEILDQILDVVGKISDALAIRATIYLDKIPTEAGLYEVTVISTDPNYKLAVDVATLTILPKTEGVTVEWLSEGAEKLSWTAAQSFEFGAKLMDGEKIADAKITWTGSSNDGTYKGLVSSKTPNLPGTYIEAARIYNKNYGYRTASRIVNIAKEYTKIDAKVIGGEDMPALLDADEVPTAYVDYNGERIDMESLFEFTLVEESNDEANTGLTDDIKATHVTAPKYSFVFVDEATGETYYDLAPIHAGTYAVTVTYKGNANHAASKTTVKVVVHALVVDIVYPETRTFTYGEHSDLEEYIAKNLEGSNEYSFKVTDDNGNEASAEAQAYVANMGIHTVVTGNKVKWPHVGSYNYTAKVNSPSPSVTVNTTEGTLAITERKITVSLGEYTKFIDEKDPKFNQYTVTQNWAMVKNEDNLCNDDKLSDLKIVVYREPGLTAGTYTVSAKDFDPDYDITFVNGKLTIKKSLVKLDEIKKIETVYTGNAVEFTDDNYVIVDENEKHNDDVKVVVEYYNSKLQKLDSAPVEAGKYTVHMHVVANDLTHTYETEGLLIKCQKTYKSTIVIKPAQVDVEISDVAITYGDATPTAADFTVTLKGEHVANLTEEVKNALIANVKANLKIENASELMPAGEYAVSSVVDAVSSINWSKGEYKATLTVNKRPVTISIDNKTKYTDQKDPAFTYTVVEGSVLEGDVLLNLVRNDLSNKAGKYDIIAESFNANYAVSFLNAKETGTLTIKNRVVYTKPVVNTASK